MCKSKKIKIVFAGLYNDDNLGDPVIAKCTEELYKSFLPKDSYVIDYISINHFCFFQPSFITRKLIALSAYTSFDLSPITERLIKRCYINYFDKRLKGADVIVVVGGGLLEFIGGRFADGLYAIAHGGYKHKIPVIINATGVEGYDITNKRCRELKEMLHLGSVRYISTRDDIVTLQDKYFDGNVPIKCDKVADPAVWASEIFGIKKDTNSTSIGLGIVRTNIFKQYGYEFDEIQAVNLYCDTYIQLINLGFDVVLFTNGTTADNESLSDVVEQLRHKGYAPKICIPHTATELLEELATFKGVIAGRLHSCIISYSLNIPAIGLVWNKKLELFGREIKEPGNFIDVCNFSPDYLVNALLKAIKKGYDMQYRNEYRNTILKSIKECVAKFIAPIRL